MYSRDTTNPRAPTIMRISPTVISATPSTLVVTA
jgi:hypothetical protein